MLQWEDPDNSLSEPGAKETTDEQPPEPVATDIKDLDPTSFLRQHNCPHDHDPQRSVEMRLRVRQTSVDSPLEKGGMDFFIDPASVYCKQQPLEYEIWQTPRPIWRATTDPSSTGIPASSAVVCYVSTLALALPCLR